MAQTLAQITKQIEKLQKEADALRQAELKGVVDRIKVAISHYGLTPDQLGFGKTAVKSMKVAKTGASSSSKTAAPRFANSEGQVWSGRGPRPHWLREALANGRSLDEFSTDTHKRASKANADPKQGDAVASVTSPVRTNVVAKRVKRGITKSKVVANPAASSSDGLAPAVNSVGVTAPNSKRKVPTSPAKSPSGKKTLVQKKAAVAVDGAPHSKVKRGRAAAAAKKTATTTSAEKSGTPASMPAVN